MPNDIKYFDYVVHYGATNNKNYYGLYQPVLDCFLVILDSLSLIEQLSALLTSRYSSRIINITPADNFDPSQLSDDLRIIDNAMCENWSISNKIKFNPAYSLAIPLEPNDIPTADRLVPTQRNIDWDILQEKQYIWVCIHWLKFLENFENKHERYYKMDHYLKYFLDIDHIGWSDFDAEKQEIKKQIMRVLYFGRNAETVDQQCFKIAEPWIN